MSSTEAPSQNVSTLNIETQHQSIPMERQSLLRSWHLFGSPPSAKEAGKKKLSKAHGFFFAMGGFVSHGGFPITTLDQISGKSDVAKGYRKDIQRHREEEINDRSKGDALSKGLALFQVLWFITQCIGHQIQHLPITSLEIATIAFAVLNIFIWHLWWNKPLGIDVPVCIGPQDVTGGTLAKTDLEQRIFSGPLLGEYHSYLPEHSTSVPLFWSSDLPSLVESMMWKVAAVFITGFPVAWVVFSLADPHWDAIVYHCQSLPACTATYILAQSSCWGIPAG
ncbi:hypothetical protein C8J56DRAFT_520553 [Mycena floridula]|nr:hypothetical protein C8J56DRAFT_520553 [Mycena floridula]